MVRALPQVVAAGVDDAVARGLDVEEVGVRAVHALPARAGVLAAPHAAVRAEAAPENPLGIRGVDGKTIEHAPGAGLVRELLPRVAAVDGFEDAAAREAAVGFGVAVDAEVHREGIRRIDGEGAGVAFAPHRVLFREHGREAGGALECLSGIIAHNDVVRVFLRAAPGRDGRDDVEFAIVLLEGRDAPVVAAFAFRVLAGGELLPGGAVVGAREEPFVHGGGEDAAAGEAQVVEAGDVGAAGAFAPGAAAIGADGVVPVGGDEERVGVGRAHREVRRGAQILPAVHVAVGLGRVADEVARERAGGLPGFAAVVGAEAISAPGAIADEVDDIRVARVYGDFALRDVGGESGAFRPCLPAVRGLPDAVLLEGADQRAGPAGDDREVGGVAGRFKLPPRLAGVGAFEDAQLAVADVHGGGVGRVEDD